MPTGFPTEPTDRGERLARREAIKKALRKCELRTLAELYRRARRKAEDIRDVGEEPPTDCAYSKISLWSDEQFRKCLSDGHVLYGVCLRLFCDVFSDTGFGSRSPEEWMQVINNPTRQSVDSVGRTIAAGVDEQFLAAAEAGTDNLIDLLTSASGNSDPSFLKAVEIIWIKSTIGALETFLASETFLKSFSPHSFSKEIERVLKNYAPVSTKDPLDISLQQLIESFENPLASPPYEIIKTNLYEIVRKQIQGEGDWRELERLKNLLDASMIESTDRVLAESKDFQTQFQRILVDSHHKGAQLRSAWAVQSLWLRRQFHSEPLWAFEKATVSLSDVYVPPRAEKRVTSPGTSTSSRKLLWLEEYVTEWIDDSGGLDAKNHPLIISGGPGSGKSSFAKALASHLTYKTSLRILLIEAQHLSHQGDLADRIGDYLTKGGNFTENPLLWKRLESETLLLIFDGLDEVTNPDQDKEYSSEFVGQVVSLLHQLNHQNHWVKAIVFGRPASAVTAISVNGLSRSSILEMCPTTPVEPTEMEKSELEKALKNSKDGDTPAVRSEALRKIRSLHELLDIARIDQREEFWKRLSSVSKTDSRYIEENPLKRIGYGELTSEPILIFLLFLSGEFERYADENKEINTAELYAKIFARLRPRYWSDSEHPSTRGIIDDEQYLFLLECLGLAAWVLGGRIGAVSTFEELRNELAAPESWKSLCALPAAALENIATSFYTKSEGGFEFVHKSFSDFLASRGILRFFTITVISLLSKEGPRSALSRITSVLAKQSLTSDVLNFFSHEIERFTQEEIDKFISSYEILLDFSVTNGLNISNFKEGEGLYDAIYASAQSDLLIKGVHSALWLSRKRRYGLVKEFRIDWNNAQNSPTDWINRLRRVSNDSFVFSILAGMSLPGIELSGVETRDARFDGCDLSGAKIHFCHFESGSFTYCDLSGADVRGSDLASCDFEWANTANLTLEHAKLPIQLEMVTGNKRHDTVM